VALYDAAGHGKSKRATAELGKSLVRALGDNPGIVCIYPGIVCI